MRRLLNQILPFILLGIAIAAFAFGVILFAYLLLFGAIIGLILFIITWIRERFFPSKSIVKPHHEPKSGRIIDSDDWKEM